eukprot:GFUD01068532.1.p1 GENE.GFUD01068532.1~~GFUD01068532.1.p1  ORF type:complete len:167 (+),score=22.89 GFUD01068532.1:34-534(+)
MEGRNRFDRCLTPMGTVPISVIYGFNYPVNENKNISSNIPRRGAEIIPDTKTARMSSAWPSSLGSAWPSSITSRQDLYTKESYRARAELSPTKERAIKSVEPTVSNKPNPSNIPAYTGYPTLLNRDTPRYASSSNYASTSCRSYILPRWSGSSMRSTFSSFRRKLF